MSILPPSRAVTVSIVSHGHMQLLPALLAQLEAYCHSVIDKVILTINTPEPVATLEDTQLPLVILVNPSPKGFGTNHNRAFAHCTSPWFLVLNPDVSLRHDVLTELIQRALPRQGLLATQIIEPGQSLPVAERFPPSPWELLRRYAHLPMHTARTYWVAGLFMLIRREAYEQIGGFDEKFHMYCEDFDLCARLQLAGWEIHRAPDLHIAHAAQRASHVNPRHMGWHLSSLLKLWLSPAWWRFIGRGPF